MVCDLWEDKSMWISLEFVYNTSFTVQRFLLLLVVQSCENHDSCFTTGGFAHLYFSMPVKDLLFSYSVLSGSLWPCELQHARLPCLSLSPSVCTNSCPLSRWCHPTISSSVSLFSSCPKSLPASGSFPMSQLFAWGGQSVGASASASVLPMNIQDRFPLGWTGWISLQDNCML